MTSKSASNKPEKTHPAHPKSLSLALQGGGSHGAYTWGVLDRLLEDRRIHLEAISGTSAGAMNAVVLAAGLQKGGREGARKLLHRFWLAASRAAIFSPLQRTPWDRLIGNWSLNNSPGYLVADLVSRVASPYSLNPLGINPLKDFLAEQIDFEEVRHSPAIRLFISATNVRTGRIRVFANEQLTPEAIMASACLPNLFPAVEIDGEAYWDGGYSGNPALHPLIYHCGGYDILIVQINPQEEPEVPHSAREILDRVNEITFNSSLLAELRAIRFVTRQLDAGHLDPKYYKRLNMHRIDAHLQGMDASSKLNAEWDFLCVLRDMGYQATDKWLKENYGHIGKESTLDLNAVLD